MFTIPVGTKPLGVAMGPLGLHAYVANSGSGTVSVLDIGDLTVSTALGPYNTPTALGVSPDSSLVYTTDSTTNAVRTAQKDVLAVTDTIAVGNTPAAIAVSPGGIRLYVTNENSATLSVINALTSTVLTTVPVGTQPTGVAVNAGGLEVYVANTADNTLSVISTVTNTVVATIGGMSAPLGVAVSRDTLHVYVTNSAANTVSVIDTGTRTITATIPVGTTPWGVVTSSDNLWAYVANHGSDTVSVIDATTSTVTETIAVGHQPAGIAVTPNGVDIYVTNSGANTVSVIQTLNQMAPTLGPQSGGTKVTITGTGLANATSVHFDNASAPIIANAANRILVVSPPGVGVAQVAVTTPGGTSNPKPFTYAPSGSASSINPAVGPTAGRNIVTIDGSKLATANAVLFGTRLAPPLIVSDQQITAAVPPGAAPGPTPVTVTTAGGLATETLTYTYVDPPGLTGLSTSTGSQVGGGVIDLTGLNLGTVTSVVFNGLHALFSVGADNTLAAVVPPSPITGPVDVTVTTAGGTSTLPGGYTYT
ncbi:IPT/TIG domain-containing protein [Streptomyces sp. JV185]|uniref:IPT/TIG domain-containing protein n=1 Tax=Streptomyces sp. JV185 TaxID=858638 RepID=UPI002E768C3E|nr:IPT/TIG domain-containing protein [Streptomyces sp. JV185]MEE1771270.1 IPT/TIG domain-containing protein [Streptomyces sp. JV185]